MKYIATSLMIITAIFIISCEDGSLIEPQGFTDQELEAIVKGNSVTLIEAIEAFARDNLGCYPTSVDSDTTTTGRTLIDYLPDSERLINPYTGVKDQPINGIPSSPGAIGYEKYEYMDSYYYNVFFIKGYGINEIIIEHDNIEETESLIISDCLVLQEAVEKWSSDDIEHRYPCFQANENIPLCNTLEDYLPNEIALRNRLTLYLSEPSRMGSIAVLPGEIGYECNVDQGITVGYTITAVGFEPGVIIFQLSVY